jgi:hypothetical protein
VSLLAPALTNSILDSNPFFSFLSTLVYNAGFEGFDIYTDRTVVFLVSHDGTTVERLVIPTLERLERAVVNYVDEIPLCCSSDVSDVVSEAEERLYYTINEWLTEGHNHTLIRTVADPKAETKSVVVNHTSALFI